MIASFNHKGLKRLYENDDRKLIRPDLVEKIVNFLTALSVAKTIEDLDLPAYRLHPLKGDRKGAWAMTVRANWRIVFEFADGEASRVELIDYH